MSNHRETNPAGSTQTPRAVLAAACEAGGVALLVYLVFSRFFYREFGLNVTFGVERILLVIIAGAFVVLRRLAVRLDPRATLASFTVLAASSATLILLLALGVNVAAPVELVLFPVRSRLLALVRGPTQARGIHRVDDRYGFVHIPNTTAIRYGRWWTNAGAYTIDADGHRMMPSPAAPRGTVVFLGDSFTFGGGVGDDETYPYVLATRYWTDLRVINAGVDGWGLSECHLALADMLARPPFPSAVILALIADDLHRSYLRPPAMQGPRQRLEWIDGAFVPRTFPYDFTPFGETPELLEKEAQLARSSIEAMAATARDKGVAFAVVLLDDTNDTAFPPDFVYELGRLEVPTLDLTHLGQSTIPYDLHPDAAGHRTIAATIASSLLTPVVYGRPSDENVRDNPSEHGQAASR